MSATECPRHLLLLHKPAAHHLVDRRLHIRRADRLPLPVPFSVVRHRSAVVPDVGPQVRHPRRQLVRWGRLSADQVQVHKQAVDAIQRPCHNRCLTLSICFDAAAPSSARSACSALVCCCSTVSRMVMWNQSIRCSLFGCRYSCTCRTSSPPSDMKTTCWLSCIPCDFITSHTRCRGFWS